ncbi:MAG: hypothetical protein E7680_05560 [Ruminococcaceae bacterium]|nr:hypothetical protein [Oscillospiraceae bacterium]
MKKIVAFLLLVSLIALTLTLQVFGTTTDTATVEVESVTARVGTTVEVAVSISNNPGIASMGFTLSFDEGLKLVKAQNGEAFSELMFTPPAKLKNGGITGSCRFAWIGTENVTEDGIILNLQFEVDESLAGNTECAISASFASGDVLDENRNTIEINSVNGIVTVIDYIPGDVDGNGIINMLDVLSLCQYYVDGCKYDPEGYAVTINENAGDVDGSGNINMLDVLTLCQYYVDGCQYDPDGYGVVLTYGKMGNATPDTPHTHNYGDWIVDQAATCTTAGRRHKICTECGETVTEEIRAVGHSYGEWINEVPATCTTEGAKGHYHCSRCGKDFDENYNEIADLIIPILMPEEKGYIRIDANGNEDDNGDYILFGSYPQSEVTDSALKNILNKQAGDFPTASDAQNWIPYLYDFHNFRWFMWYQDITLNGETYRGVFFTAYRQKQTSSYESSSEYSLQDDNGYINKHVYWFRYEPIKWRILSEDEGTALILCENIIDCYHYEHERGTRTINEKKVYSCNYEYSDIRIWLNEVFYETAFSDLEKALIEITAVDNSAKSTYMHSYDGFPDNKNAGNDTNDKVFLLSRSDVTNDAYGFDDDFDSKDVARQKMATYYAGVQGSELLDGEGNLIFARWWLRSPSHINCGEVYYVSGSGQDFYQYTDQCMGIVPALQIQL